YAQYSPVEGVPQTTIGSGAASSPAAVPGPANPQADNPKDDVFVTPQPAAQAPIVGTEEKIEYRDESGNLLNDEQVKELEGRVSFKTRYETRTRLVDQMGNEIHDGILEPDTEGVAGTIAEGENPPTSGVPETLAKEVPASVAVSDDVEKEKSVEMSDAGSARPESSAGEATTKA
ncbi:Dolichyl-phosphate-mannose--protein mannosyltransferase 1, partial [Cryomyces antarcticus]